MKIKKYSLKIISYSLILSFSLSAFFGTLYLALGTASADELIEQAFMPAKTHETIINLGDTKDAVGNEILRESVGYKEDLGVGCFVNNQKIDDGDLAVQKAGVGYGGSVEDFCKNVLGGTYDELSWSNLDPTSSEGAQAQAPLIVRITKFLLRITVVLSITMVIYSGIMYIVEASKGAEVKEAQNNLMYIVGGVLLALMSVGLINLISSFSISSLNITSKPGCMINGQVLNSANEGLEQYICLRAGFGHSEETVGIDGKIIGREWNPNKNAITNKHCKIAGEWKKILDSELQPKCIELGGQRK